MVDKIEHKKTTEEKRKAGSVSKETEDSTSKIECNDRCCPIHGNLSVRGRSFKGTVIKKFPKRVVITFDRTVYAPKYERYSKRRTKLHARLPECMNKDIELGDYIEIMETRPISKITNFVVIKKIHSIGEKQTGGTKE